MKRIISQALQVAAGGLIAGTVMWLLLTRFIESRVKGVSVYDIVTFVWVAALIGGVALCAAAIPARRAAKLDPQLALRSEEPRGREAVTRPHPFHPHYTPPVIAGECCWDCCLSS